MGFALSYWRRVIKFFFLRIAVALVFSTPPLVLAFVIASCLHVAEVSISLGFSRAFLIAVGLAALLADYRLLLTPALIVSHDMPAVAAARLSNRLVKSGTPPVRYAFLLLVAVPQAAGWVLMFASTGRLWTAAIQVIILLISRLLAVCLMVEAMKSFDAEAIGLLNETGAT